jgi:hypothetical protein
MIVLMKPLHLMGNDAGLVDQECSKTTLHRRDKGCHFHDQTSAKTYVFISTPPNATSKPTPPQLRSRYFAATKGSKQERVSSSGAEKATHTPSQRKPLPENPLIFHFPHPHSWIPSWL